MKNQNLLESLEKYKVKYPDETETAEKFIEFIQNDPDCFVNENPNGHITAIAWLVDSKAKKIGLVHHRKLGIWIAPGGHSDGKPDPVETAYREAIEEFGIENINLASNEIFDIDIHTIPVDRKRGLEEHLHYDIRFLFFSDSSQNPKKSFESNEAKWVKLDEIDDYKLNENMLRMIRKTKKIINPPAPNNSSK